MKNKGTHGYTICSCGKRAWAIHSNGSCTACITASELYAILYPPHPEEPKKRLSKPTVAQLREKFAAQREAKS